MTKPRKAAGQTAARGRAPARRPASDRADDFFDRVWEVVQRIPRGRVTTYGHIAGYLGSRSAARTVGWALNASKATLLPAHRVVNRNGELTGALQFGGPHIMEDLLRSEGVAFDDKGRVRMDRHLWDPSVQVMSDE